ncbi:MAG TPA: SRPBCC family protein [Acidimicrobiia bacterium]|nr:SRPBCC family protein [Acidimicrobiia bacterium]
MTTSPLRPVHVSHHIPANPSQVLAFVSDTRNDPIWCPNVTGVNQTEGDGVGLGSRFEFHQTVEAGGRKLESDVEVEVVGLTEDSVRWRVEDRFQIRDVTLTVEPHGNGTRVRQRTLATFKRDPGLARWLYPFLARRTFRDQFSRLAAHYSEVD